MCHSVYVPVCVGVHTGTWNLLVVPTVRKFKQPGALLWRKHLGNIRQGRHQPLRGGVRKLQFGAAEIP